MSFHSSENSLVSGVMMDSEYKESVIGTPQGGNLSPFTEHQYHVK